MPNVLPLGEWLPDMPAYTNPGMTVARNVVPLTPTSYGPLRSLEVFSGNPTGNPIPALPAQPYGLYSFLDRLGSEHIFAGTLTKLYRFKTGDTQFEDVSKASTTYTATPDSPWSMVAIGNSIIATNGNDPPQVFDIDTDTKFDDLNRNRAPYGLYAVQVRDFLFLANVTEPSTGIHYPNRAHWSSIGDPVGWPDIGTDEAAQLQSDANDFHSDYGHIRGIAAGLQTADVAIFMDSAIYWGSYIGGAAIFNFQVAQGATGCRVPRSIVTNRGMAYYLGSQGWESFDGTNPHPIGQNKIDKWFYDDPDDGVDPNFLQLTQGTVDPNGKNIFWSYCGPDSGGTPNRILIYNFSLDRFSMARVEGLWLGKGLSTGYSLEELDAFGDLDTIEPNLDSPVWQGGRPFLVAFNDNFEITSFTGDNLEATIETMEIEPTPFHRSRVTSARPLVDGGTPAIAMGIRNRLQDTPAYANDVSMNVWGECAVRTDSRFVRARLTIPAASDWTHAQGIEIDAGRSTKR